MSIVESLHGLPCQGVWDEEDLESVADLPGGKMLLEWIASQFSGEGGISSSRKGSKVSRDAGGVELEAEQKLVPHIEEAAPYMSSSHLKGYAEYVRQENDLLEQELDSTRIRASMTKEAYKEVRQTNKLLRNTLFSLGSNLLASDEALLELSINADDGISSTLDGAHALLCNLGLPQTNSSHDSGTKNVELPWDFLHSIQKDITNLTRSLRRYLESYQRLCEAEAAHKSSIETEYERLDRIFRSFPVQSRKPSGNSINALLVQAWAQDQSNILKFHEEILDNAISLFDASSLPLEGLHKSLSSLASCVQNVEATLEALGEELGDIHTEKIPIPEDKTVHENNDLENDLKLHFNKSKALQTGSTPLVVLDKDDILAQLRLIQERYDSLETQEMIWANQILHQYTKQRKKRNSTVHPSESSSKAFPPFDFPADVQTLETNTREETKILQQLANSVEEEVHEAFSKESHLLRLQNFIDRISR